MTESTPYIMLSITRSSSHHELFCVSHDPPSNQSSAVTDQSGLVTHQSSAVADQSGLVARQSSVSHLLSLISQVLLLQSGN